MSIIPTTRQRREPSVDPTFQPPWEDWFIQRRWPGGVTCLRCAGPVRYVVNRRPTPFRCADRECGRQFSVKTGTFMAQSTMSLEQWRRAFSVLRGCLWSVGVGRLMRELRVTRPCASAVLVRVQRAVRLGEWLPVPVWWLESGIAPDGVDKSDI